MSEAVNAPAPRADRDAGSTFGLILNGGRASRMGGIDKGLAALGGRAMLAYVIERLHPQCATLALSANGEPARFSSFGLAVVADDPLGFAGPLAGVLAGLEFCARHAPSATHVASLAADTPFAPSDFVARLHEARWEAGAEIVVAASGGRLHHVAALWPVDCAPALRRALEDGVRRIESFAARYRLAVAEWPSDPFDPFININAPEDLERAESLLREISGS